MKKSSTYQLVLAALFLALGILLPIILHPLGDFGRVLLPMHIPVLLCGLIVGWKYGALTGLLVPILASLFTGKPPLFPIGVSMAFELAAYGLVAGLLSKKYNVFVALIGAMLAGRVVMGLVNLVLMSKPGAPYTLSAFMAGAFITALPGIVLQLVLLPAIVLALKKTGVLERLS